MLGLFKKIVLLSFGLLLLFGCSQESKSDKFVVGMECNYAPFNWTSTNMNGVKISDVDFCDGYDVDIAKKIALELGKELEIKKIAWEGLIPGVNNSEIDAIIAGMTNTKERSEAVDFTNPYYESDMVLIVSKDSKYVNAKSLKDFENARVLGQLNTLYDEVIDQIPNVKHETPLANYTFMIMALKNKTVDALVAELPVANGVVSANPEFAIVQFSSGNGFVADTTVSIAIKKGNSELLAKLNATLDKINKDERNKMMEAAVKRQPAMK